MNETGSVGISLIRCIVYDAISNHNEEVISRYENPLSLYHFAVKEIIAEYRTLYPKNQSKLF